MGDEPIAMNRFSSSIAPWIGLLVILTAGGIVWQTLAWRLVAKNRPLIGAIGHPQPLNDRVFLRSSDGLRIERQVFVIPLVVTFAATLSVLFAITMLFARRAPLKVVSAWIITITLACTYLAVNFYLYALATNTFM
jgi:hypothetical protein